MLPNKCFCICKAVYQLADWSILLFSFALEINFQWLKLTKSHHYYRWYVCWQIPTRGGMCADPPCHVRVWWPGYVGGRRWDVEVQPGQQPLEQTPGRTWGQLLWDKELLKKIWGSYLRALRESSSLNKINYKFKWFFYVNIHCHGTESQN